MDFLEKLNKLFGTWYESLFGDLDSEIRPKDVLRKIIKTMEDNRKEGLDNRIYVPNKYILQLSFDSDEEREYLLAFLDKEELETALKKYMAQNDYHVRGPLDFTIEEVEKAEGEVESEKLRVKCKWDFQHVGEEARSPEALSVLNVETQGPNSIYEEDLTVADTDLYDASTVAPPLLLIKNPDGSTQRFLLTKPVVVIGRSRRLNNDLILGRDGMVSKRHAKIELTQKGFVIKDLHSTNGVWVNNERVFDPNGRLLEDGDVIRLGATELVFKQGDGVRQFATDVKIRRARLVSEDGGEDFLLASKVTIGRSLGSDLRLDHPSVSRRHAMIVSMGDDYYIEDLGSTYGTWLNEIRLPVASRTKLHRGDLIQIGEVRLRFEVD
jgi:pSer/pThr/pTyr-binding forkhead associated (FHA) protein